MVNVLPKVTKLGRMTLNLLFPKGCIVCDWEADFICYSCRSLLPRVMSPLCPRCGSPQPDGILCSGCVSWQAEIDGIRSPFRFGGTMRQTIYQLKYRNLGVLSGPFAQLLNDVTVK